LKLSLLAATQGLIERTYRTASGVEDAGRFVVGDHGYRRLARRHEIVRVLDVPWKAPLGDPSSPVGPRVLVRRLDRGTALTIYFPDALIRHLESLPPTRVLDDRNVDEFAVFVEEVDHFVVLSHGFSHQRAMNLLELEIRANVSKALVLSHFLGRLAGRPRLHPGQRVWVRYHLFEKPCYCREEDGVRERYEEARRLAVRLLDRLEGMTAAHRIRELRRWNALPAPLKLRELAVS
jgi:hypothetical protein